MDQGGGERWSGAITAVGRREFATRPAERARRWHRGGVALSLIVASVWISFGLYFKLFDGVPRHRQIVQSIPGLAGSRGVVLVRLVGVGETLLGLWIVVGRAPRLTALLQTLLVLTMNVLELQFARQHLLWPAGLIPANLVFLSIAWLSAELRSSEPFYWLRRHPFAVAAYFDHSLVLTYALPESVLRPLLPPGLRLDTQRGYGFVAVALVKTRRLRPSGFPAALGQDFTLAGYRVFVSLPHRGRTRRGLFILRSDASGQLVVRAGNLLTHYQYRFCKATWREQDEQLTVEIATPDATAEVRVTADLQDGAPVLPNGSVFDSPHEAFRFAGPMPWTFDYESTTHSIVMIRGERQGWSPRLVPVVVERVRFFQHGEFAGTLPILSSAFHVQKIPYRWRRGIRVRLRGDATE